MDYRNPAYIEEFVETFECPDCDGIGRIYDEHAIDEEDSYTCHRCDGHGLIE